MKRILIIALSDLENDPRVYRQINYLRNQYHVSTIGWEPAQIEGVPFFELKPPSRSNVVRLKRALEYKLGRYEKLYWSLYPFQPVIDRLAGESFDLIFANDIDSLPFALRLAQASKTDCNVLLDLHEYAPRQFEDRFLWRFIFRGFNRYLCRTYLKQCDKIITVSSALADEYHREYGIKPDVITSASEYFPLEPVPVSSDRIRIIHHGVANPNRRLETMIQTMALVDSRFHLDLMLLPTYPRYYKRLQALAAKYSNVNIIPPVSREEIIPSIHNYDLSQIVFRPYTINFKYGLFNKFFESIQARLAIVSGPTPEPHVRIIQKYRCGIIADSFDIKDIAAAINRLTPEEIMTYKHNAHKAASELNAEKNMERLGRMVAQLIAKK